MINKQEFDVGVLKILPTTLCKLLQIFVTKGHVCADCRLTQLSPVLAETRTSKVWTLNPRDRVKGKIV